MRIEVEIHSQLRLIQQIKLTNNLFIKYILIEIRSHLGGCTRMLLVSRGGSTFLIKRKTNYQKKYIKKLPQLSTIVVKLQC